MPSTNAMSERSFSALRRVKSYLQSAMTHTQFNHLLLLHVPKNFTDSLDLVAVINEFASKSEDGLTYFAKFTSEDTVTATICRKCKCILTCKFCSQSIN